VLGLIVLTDWKEIFSRLRQYCVIPSYLKIALRFHRAGPFLRSLSGVIELRLVASAFTTLDFQGHTFAK
jgi:hypothetical protein